MCVGSHCSLLFLRLYYSYNPHLLEPEPVLSSLILQAWLLVLPPGAVPVTQLCGMPLCGTGRVSCFCFRLALGVGDSDISTAGWLGDVFKFPVSLLLISSSRTSWV